MDDVLQPITFIKLLSGLINEAYPVSFIVIILFNVGALIRLVSHVRITRQQFAVSKDLMEEIHRKR